MCQQETEIGSKIWYDNMGVQKGCILNTYRTPKSRKIEYVTVYVL